MQTVPAIEALGVSEDLAWIWPSIWQSAYMVRDGSLCGLQSQKSYISICGVYMCLCVRACVALSLCQNGFGSSMLHRDMRWASIHIVLWHDGGGRCVRVQVLE